MGIYQSTFFSFSKQKKNNLLSFLTRVFVALVLMLSCANASVPECCNY
jgi:hypothetical protein